MFVRVMFFDENSKPMVASDELKDAFKKLEIDNPIVEMGYIDIDTEKDSTYIDLLLKSDVVEIFDGVYKIKRRDFRAMKGYALWITLGEKLE